jgi:hypothetical protein
MSEPPGYSLKHSATYCNVTYTRIHCCCSEENVLQNSSFSFRGSKRFFIHTDFCRGALSLELRRFWTHVDTFLGHVRIRARNDRIGFGRRVFYVSAPCSMLGNGPINTNSDNRRGVFCVVRAMSSVR